MTKEIYFIKFSSAILEFTTNYHKEVVIKIMENEDYVNEPKRFFYTLIHKIITTLDASNIFIRNFDNKRNYNSSLFILFRSCLSDNTLAEYVIKQGKSDKERSLLIKRMYYDHIDNAIKSINKTARKVYSWTDEEVLYEINDIKSSQAPISSSIALGLKHAD